MPHGPHAIQEILQFRELQHRVRCSYHTERTRNLQGKMGIIHL